MSSKSSRRRFLAGFGSVMAVSVAPGRESISHGPWAIGLAESSTPASAQVFKLSVLTDEISQDFGHALEVAVREFGMTWVDLRELWKKNILRLDSKELEEARRLIERYKVRVGAIASPVFKVDWPGAPLSKYSPKRDQFNADFTFKEQDSALEHSFELARLFKTDHVRIFDFWRIDDPAPYRAEMDAKLREAAEKAGTRKITLALENEYACNTATSAEAARILAAVPLPYFKLTWDPGNAAFRDETPFPQGYSLVPKDRIAHLHCKDAVRKADGSYEWAAMGKGLVDWVGIFRALKRDGYRGPATLETHWRGAGTPEESSRQSWAGMKEQLRQAGAI